MGVLQSPSYLLKVMVYNARKCLQSTSPNPSTPTLPPNHRPQRLLLHTCSPSWPLYYPLGSPGQRSVYHLVKSIVTQFSSTQPDQGPWPSRFHMLVSRLVAANPRGDVNKEVRYLSVSMKLVWAPQPRCEGNYALQRCL
jgi:hypothetical protein